MSTHNICLHGEIRKISCGYSFLPGVMYFTQLSQCTTKTYNKTCVTSKDSDQPVHPPSMARVLVHPSLDRTEVVEGTCNQ